MEHHGGRGPLLLPVFAAAEPPAVESAFSVKLPPHRFAGDLLPGSPFGINTALRPDTPDLEARLAAMQEAGMSLKLLTRDWSKGLEAGYNFG